MSGPESEPLDAWKDINQCETCGESDAHLRAIRMKQGRRQMLCYGCFIQANEDGEVDPADPRVKEDTVA